MRNTEDESLRSGLSTASSMSSSAASGLFGSILKGGNKKVLYIGIGIIVFLLLMEAIFSMTSNPALGPGLEFSAFGFNQYIDADGLVSVTKEDAAENIKDLMATVRSYQKGDENSVYYQLRRYCLANGYDYDLSAARLTTRNEISYVESNDESSNKVTGEFPITSASQAQKMGLYAKTITEYPLSSVITSKQNKTTVDGRGLYKFSSYSTSDYLCAMPEVFGSVGSRYKVTGKNGKSITVMKGCSIPSANTSGVQGGFASEDALFYFICGDDAWASVYFDLSHYFQISEIAKIEKLSSEFSVSAVMDSGSDLKIIAAFSVSIDNGMFIKKVKSWQTTHDPETGIEDTKYTYGYYNNKGEEVTDSIIVDEMKGTLKYKTMLKNALTKYMNSGGYFFKLAFDTDEQGNIKVGEYPIYETKIIETEDEHGNIIEEEVEVLVETKYYVYPVREERSLYAVAKEAFGIDPDDIYINSCSWTKLADGSVVPVGNNYVTNETAINQMAKLTAVIVYGSVLSNGEIIRSEYSGAFEWPAPGYNGITSPFGERYSVPGVGYWHNGVDISCPENSVIVSPEAGTITYIGPGGNAGNMVSIDFDNGWKCNLFHLSNNTYTQYPLYSGLHVERGQAIALSGNTGYSTGPHLHIELFDPVLGRWVDPLPYIAKDESMLVILY